MSTVSIHKTYSVAASIAYQLGADADRAAAFYATTGDADSFVAYANRSAVLHSNRRIVAFNVVQSWPTTEFDKNNPDDVQRANELGREYARRLGAKDYSVVTHIDGKGGCVHNHIVMVNNSVDDKALQGLHWQRVVAINDKLMTEHGLSTPDKSPDRQSERAIHAALDGEPLEYDPIEDLKQRIRDAAAESTDLESFVAAMAQRDVSVNVRQYTAKKKDGTVREPGISYKLAGRRPAKGSKLGTDFCWAHLESVWQHNLDMQQTAPEPEPEPMPEPEPVHTLRFGSNQKKEEPHMSEEPHTVQEPEPDPALADLMRTMTAQHDAYQRTADAAEQDIDNNKQRRKSLKRNNMQRAARLRQQQQDMQNNPELAKLYIDITNERVNPASPERDTRTVDGVEVPEWAVQKWYDGDLRRPLQQWINDGKAASVMDDKAAYERLTDPKQRDTQINTPARPYDTAQTLLASICRTAMRSRDNNLGLLIAGAVIAASLMVYGRAQLKNWAVPNVHESRESYDERMRDELERRYAGIEEPTTLKGWQDTSANGDLSVTIIAKDIKNVAAYRSDDARQYAQIEMAQRAEQMASRFVDDPSLTQGPEHTM